MLGLVVLGLTFVMILNLVKNALLGKQLSKDDTFSGSIDLIIPMGPHSEFYLEAWQKSLSTPIIPSVQLKIHVLIDGHHPTSAAWEELATQIPHIEIHHFTLRPEHMEAIPWMLSQVAPKIEGKIVIVGDSELVPTEFAFTSIAKKVVDKNRSYFVVPQTAKINLVGEAITVLNPTLAFTSFFSFRKFRRNLTHPLLSISQGWMAMELKTFQELDFKTIRFSTWKESISKQWDEQSKTFFLAFGEKQLIRHYPEDLRALVLQLKERWDELWNRKGKVGFGLFVAAVFLWSFPVLCLLTHPFWAFSSFMLLMLYRFFTKIVFQESWRSIILHPLSCFFLLGTLLWWGILSLKSHYGSQAKVQS